MPNFSELDKIKFMDKQIFIFQFFNYFSNLLFFFYIKKFVVVYNVSFIFELAYKTAIFSQS